MTLPSAQDFPFSSPASKDGSDTSPNGIRIKVTNPVIITKSKQLYKSASPVYYCIIDNVYFSSTCAVYM